MSDLDKKLAQAATLAAKLKGRKYSPAVYPRKNEALEFEQLRNGADALPNGKMTDNKEKVIKKYIDAMVEKIGSDNAKSIRSDINDVLDTLEKDLDEKHHSFDDQIKTAKDVVKELHKLYDEMRPKQIVIQSGDDTTELGVIEGFQHSQFQQLLKAVMVKGRHGNRKNIILKGPAGSGKSTAGKQLAEVLELDFTYIGQTLMPHQIEGYVRQGDGVYMDTPFVRAFLYGGVCMLEEMDAWSPQATLVANPPLANNIMMLPNGELIERHKDCIIIACANTWGMGATAEYVGRNKLDAAFLDRFAFKFDWGYDDQLERNAAGNDDLVTKVQICRMNAQKAGIKVLISPRASIECADMVRANFTEKEAFELNFLSSLNPDQRATVLQGVKLDG